ncbi:MAG TPA: DotU family type IV/VI secretion system protein [Gemmatimonadaceae bacterium]|nr:DotU family type IV/VI secretion system protein [Gemmatimonadaceae bacterium]
MTIPVQTVAPPAQASAPVAPSARRGQLALAMQEVLTATVRLRANRQVAADAESFRAHMKQVMGAAEQQARQAGYADEDVRLVLYAVVTFLDESVLNSTQPMFADWPRKPLQDEIFGGHLGGELFFQNLQYLLARPDSEDGADVLEVFQLCLLLGFHGRYSASDGGELHALMSRVAEKMQRIRGPYGELSPSWKPPAGDIPSTGGDVWSKRLGIAMIAVFLIAAALFGIYTASLRSSVAAVHDAAAQVAR